MGSTPAESSGHLNSVSPYVVAIFTITGGFLRLFRITSQSFWLDEGYTIFLTKEFSLIEMIMIIMHFDNHPPLYYIIIHIWLKIFPVSEFWLRLPSAIFGILCIPGGYNLGKEIYNRQVGLFTSFMITFSSFHINYSQEARMYSLLVFLSIMASLYFLKMINYQHNNRIRIYFVLISVLMLYTHAFALLVWIAFFCFTVYLRDLRKLYTVLAVLGLYIPYIPSLFHRASIVNQGFWISEPSFTSLLNIVALYFSSLWVLLMLVAYIGMNIGLSENYFKTHAQHKVPLIMVLIHIILPLVYSVVFTPILLGKYIIFCSIVFYLVIGRYLDIHNNKKILVYLKVILIVAILVISSLNISSYYNEQNPDNWRDSMQFIDNHAEQGELIIFHSGGPIMLLLAVYYLDRADLNLTYFPSKYSEVSENNVIELEILVEGLNSTWIVLSRAVDPYNIIITSLSMNFTKVHHKFYSGIEVYSFHRYL